MIGTLCLSAFALQWVVVPLLHARHAGLQLSRAWETGDGSEGVCADADTHDTRSCPVCAVLAKSRVGIVPIATAWQLPPLSVVQLSIAPLQFVDTARSHSAAPRAPPTFSL